MGLKEYQKKRDFRKTPEPEGGEKPPSGRLYVIQKHAASRLHYDLRLELGGYLKSWAVPKGPSYVPGEKRLAVHVEDHPIEYGHFEGIIPEGEYGGGTVMLWDRGEWDAEGDPESEYERGRLHIRLYGEKLRGSWALARMGGDAGEEGKNWLLIKRRDDYAREEDDFPGDADRSVLTGRTMAEIKTAKDAVWGPDGLVRTGPEPAQSTASAANTSSIDLSGLPGAKRGTLPEDFRPQLATLVDAPPDGDEWLHELKYDGYRLIARISGDTVRLITRRGNDWTDRFPTVAGELADFPAETAILDGEVVVQLPDGTTDFQALQNLLQGAATGRLLYYLFDIPYLDGYDLTGVPLIERKAVLKLLLDRMPGTRVIRYSDHVQGKGAEVFRHACRFVLEGIISKRSDSPYRQKRTRTWVKTKCGSRQEFVIGGYTDPAGERAGFGALLLGYYDEEGQLRYCGKVGTGFSDSLLNAMTGRMAALRRKTAPFDNPPSGRGIHWIEPELVAEVEFTAWTRDDILRHPSFKGLREDKPAADVRREIPPPADEKKSVHRPSSADRTASTVAGVRLSNPNRILYPDQGITKIALARYYEQVADLILPHMTKRPLTLVRCPRGAEKTCFYQKHFDDDSVPEHLRLIDIREKDGIDRYAVLDDIRGVIRLVQMGVLEIHLWNSRADTLEQPDMMVFDLDPGPGVIWETVVEATFLLRDHLSDLGLTSFLKTSGGKGFHVVVPLVPRDGWDDVKAFTRRVAETLVRRHTERFVATMSKKKREGKIFIDYLRNSRGATSVAPWSTRARPGAPVSAPIGWDELTPALKADAFRIDNLAVRIAGGYHDPWNGFFRISQLLPGRRP